MRRRYFTKRIIWGAATCLMLLLAVDAWADRVSVKVPIANVRSGPGTSYDVLWQVEKYHPLSVLSRKDTWCRFRDFEGDQGWISASVLNNDVSVIIQKDHCNIRTGPGTRYKVAFTVDKGVPFRVIKRKNDWIHIQHADGDQGWIYKSLVW